MKFVLRFVILVFLGAVCHAQQVEDSNTTDNNVVCRRCSPDCLTIPRLDGDCSECLCDGFILPKCPNVDCPNDKDPSCGRQRTPDGCVECICVEEVEQTPLGNDALPNTVANGGTVCPSLPPCPQHCQHIDQTGCPVCDCTGENEILSGPLPDAVELCPPLPLCPVGCLETHHRGEFDCYECNCTLPEFGSTADQAIGGLNPFGDLPQNRPGFSPHDPSGEFFPSGLSPLDAGPVCGEIECPEGCRLCIGRDGCGRCLCGSDSVICPAFPPCPASCIAQDGSGCLTCACAPESLNPNLQADIIVHLPPNLQPEFVSHLPPAISPFRTPSGFPRRPVQVSPRQISNIISQFTPVFIYSLPDSVKYQLATELLSFIQPQHRPNLTPEFVSQTPPELLFRAPRPAVQNSIVPSSGRRPNFGSPFGSQFPFAGPDQGMANRPQHPAFIPQNNPGLAPGNNPQFHAPNRPQHPAFTPQNIPGLAPGNNNQALSPLNPNLGSTFGFAPSTRTRNPFNNLNYVPSDALRPQGRRQLPSSNGFMNGRLPPHSQREFVTEPTAIGSQQKNPSTTNLQNPQVPIDANSDMQPMNVAPGQTSDPSSNDPPRSSAIQDLQNRLIDALTGSSLSEAPLRNSRLEIQNVDFGRIFEPVLVWI